MNATLSLFTEKVYVTPTTLAGCPKNKKDYVYADQSAKFALWKLTKYERILFLDSDRHFVWRSPVEGQRLSSERV